MRREPEEHEHNTVYKINMCEYEGYLKIKNDTLLQWTHTKSIVVP